MPPNALRTSDGVEKGLGLLEYPFALA